MPRPLGLGEYSPKTTSVKIEENIGGFFQVQNQTSSLFYHEEDMAKQQDVHFSRKVTSSELGWQEPQYFLVTTAQSKMAEKPSHMTDDGSDMAMDLGHGLYWTTPQAQLLGQFPIHCDWSTFGWIPHIRDW